MHTCFGHFLLRVIGFIRTCFGHFLLRVIDFIRRGTMGGAEKLSQKYELKNEKKQTKTLNLSSVEKTTKFSKKCATSRRELSSSFFFDEFLAWLGAGARVGLDVGWSRMR
uniref:Uncharacterized protein n=1 Tax=Romanomermis culicivorax TaxID=13658 RepID=A0A915L3P8_ROMCU